MTTRNDTMDIQLPNSTKHAKIILGISICHTFIQRKFRAHGFKLAIGKFNTTLLPRSREESIEDTLSNSSLAHNHDHKPELRSTLH